MFMKKLLLILAACLFAGCSSVDRQVFKARQIFDKYPNEAAKYCGDKFPANDSILTIRIDSSKGKIIDYTPALISLERMLDSANAILSQKQTTLTDLTGQLTFTKAKLTNAGKLIDDLTINVNNLKTSYKPCGVDTIKSASTEIRTNTAKVMALTAQIVDDDKGKQNLQNALQTEQTKSAHRLYFLIGIILVIAIYLAYKIYKFFVGGVLISGIMR
jgi:hypothetical protein